MSKITVLKFGGSVLESEDDLPKAVHEIYRHWRRGSQVLAVVSAFGGTTDALLSKAQAFGDDSDPEAVASLLATGEATSAAHLAMALKQAGLPAKLLNPHQVDIQTEGQILDSEPVTADVLRISKELERAVVVVSGFVGVSENGDLTLLGRGGTDLTALFLAQQLDAKCVLVKDVDGLYESDPADNTKKHFRFERASYETTLKLGGELVQPKAVHFAKANRQSFELTSIGSTAETTVGNFEDKFDSDRPKQRPLRIALLGCGTVGGGVYQRLSALPELFEIVGVVNLDPNKAIVGGIDEKHLQRDAKHLIEQDCDVVLELIGGIVPAKAYIEHALRLGRHVVTANKAVVAEFGDELRSLAHNRGVTIRYSAAVGGAMPALEAVAAALAESKPRSVSGIINGTCNFVIDQLAAGLDFEAAVKLAQQEGFAEADPTMDIDGIDAAQKLILLVREAFSVNLSLNDIDCEGISRLNPTFVDRAKQNGQTYRLIAECTQNENGLSVSVKPQTVSNNHPFAQTKGADNCLIIEDKSGDTRIVRGRGAGRYATTEAVVGDLFDLREILFAPAYEQRLEAAA